MKSSEMVASLQNLRLPRNPIAPCRWDIGLEVDVEGGGIPLFSLNKGISRGKVFPMLLFNEGSVEVGVINANSSVIVYPKLMHHLKGLSQVKPQIPEKAKLIHKKLFTLKNLLKDLVSMNSKELDSLRVELQVVGYFTFSEAMSEAVRLLPLDDLPNGVSCVRRVLFKDYISNIELTIANIEKGHIFQGRNTSKLNAGQKHHMSKLLNAFGFSHERRLRHLKLPKCQTKTVVKGQVYAVPPNSDTD